MILCDVCKKEEVKFMVVYEDCQLNYSFKVTKRCTNCMLIAKRNECKGNKITIEPFYAYNE